MGLEGLIPGTSQLRQSPPVGSTEASGPWSADLTKDSMVQSVQLHLEALGINPGNTNGDNSLDTQIAVSQFQARKGMPVAEYRSGFRYSNQARSRHQTTNLEAPRMCANRFYVYPVLRQSVRSGLFSLIPACFFASPLVFAEDDADIPECCRCDWTQTQTFEPTDEFPCSFEYPAGWEARYIPSDNSVDIRAPRCEQRCGGSRSIVFSVAKYKNNNWEYLESHWQTSALPVGRAECGGRTVTFFQSKESDEHTTHGAMSFLVGKFDGLNYDARLALDCAVPGEWQKLQRLIIDTLK